MDVSSLLWTKVLHYDSHHLRWKTGLGTSEGPAAPHHWPLLHSWFCHICTNGLGSCSVTRSWMLLMVQMGKLSRWAGRGGVARGCICSTLRFRWVVCVRVKSMWVPGPRVSQQTIVLWESAARKTTTHKTMKINGGHLGSEEGELEPQECKGPSEFQPAMVWYLDVIPSGQLPTEAFWWRPPWKMPRCMYGRFCADAQKSQNRHEMESIHNRPQIIYMEAAATIYSSFSLSPYV